MREKKSEPVRVPVRMVDLVVFFVRVNPRNFTPFDFLQFFSSDIIFRDGDVFVSDACGCSFLLFLSPPPFFLFLFLFFIFCACTSAIGAASRR